MKSVVTSSTYSLPIARGFSRISTVFFSFFKGGDNAKEVTTYNHPLAGAPSSTDGDTLRYHLSLGSWRCPVFDVDSVCEQYHRLRTAATVLDHTNTVIDISPYAYRNNKAIFAINLEKVIQEQDLDLGNSGMSSRGGSQMTLQLKGCPQNADGTPVMIHVCILFDSITQLSSAGVVQMD